jgi:hypothetical protein
MTKTTKLKLYSPPVALLILKGKSATQGELLRLTFFDLVYRNLLRIEERKNGTIGTENDAPMHYISLTDAGKHYQPKTWEGPFFAPFAIDHDYELLFTAMLKIVRGKIEYPAHYRQLLAIQGGFSDQFYQTWWQQIFGGFRLTVQGEATQKALLEELQEIRAQLKRDDTQDRNISSEILQNLGIQALLIEGLDFSLLPTDHPLKSMQANGFSNNYDVMTNACGGCSGGVEYWGSMSGAFDHMGHGHDGDSGCGGDSGCSSGDSGCGGSGCSGCGGGCGGD